VCKVISIAAILVLLLSLTSCVGNPQPDSSDDAGTHNFEAFTDFDTSLYSAIIEAEANWLVSIQTESGAIPLVLGMPIANINPYFACFAALGLVEAGRYDAVIKYMDWHLSHLNRTPDVNGHVGTIYDWMEDVITGEEAPTKKYDSTDSYAALFLMLADSFIAKSGNTEYFKDKKADIELIYDAMMSTESYGLTWATPTYKVKYTMDNSEVYAGIKSAENLMKNFYNDEAKATEYGAKGQELREALEEVLWNGDQHRYYQGKGFNAILPTDITQFYPDALCQFYPALFGAIEPQGVRAKQLFSTFSENHDWTQIKTKEYPMVIMCQAAAAIGDYKRTHTYLVGVKTEYIDKNHPSPWYCMESGCSILTAALMIQAANEK